MNGRSDGARQEWVGEDKAGRRKNWVRIRREEEVDSTVITTINTH